MPKHDKESSEILSLIAKLEDVSREFDKKQPTKCGYANAKEIVNLAIARALCPYDTERREIEQKEQERHAKLNPKIELSVTQLELSEIIRGLCYLQQSKIAEEYVKDSIATGITNEQRWSAVAEIMLIKNPDEKLSLHGIDELIWYSVMINSGKKPRQASEEVFKKFSFNSLEACDKWLRREIEKYQKNSLYDWLVGNLPKPSTAPRTK